MKQCLSVLLVMLLLLTVGCGSSSRYGGVDAAGDTAKDVVNKFYRVFDEQGAVSAYDMLQDDIENSVVEDISLVELSHCEEVERGELGDSEIAEIPDDVYAFCYVQTADTVLCNEDGATGAKGEEVSRNHVYILVMKTQDSKWEITDCGYPPIYVPEE